MPLLRQNVKNRKASSYADPDRVLTLFNEHRKIRFELDQLRKRRNEHSALTKQIVTIEDDRVREDKLSQHTKVGKTYKKQVQDREQILDTLEHELVEQALKLPNKTHHDSPVGDETKNKVVRKGGPAILQTQKAEMGHLEIAKEFDLLDFASASKLTGNKFVFLKNEAALLEMALCNWAMNLVASKGYTAISTPDIAAIVRSGGLRVPAEGRRQPGLSPFNGSHHSQDEECLIGTAEIPLAGMYAHEMLRRDALPGKMVAFSHCFRKEAGKGEHSKGLYRLHQFSKVEMFALTRGEVSQSEQALEEMVAIQTEIVQSLGLSYRVLDMATEELGAAAFRKYDIEVWMPSRGDYGEICSASNCTSYQSRRLNICYLDEQNDRKLAHTVNGTALAVPRII
eukprot:CAMPEP_0170467896 /NCGR_PEP_ID=MMETSP0123-20130129/11293_1 /TAXON_ID=182087 /ORGANISM="Favella ehrenbergii, Strain Fehren 1" /LENGTH=396 /DNA_ID=CAMNT_0010734357 /DNA_START=194 /DNA_END=1384 /DNA_ORIENTATION=-